ncbi:MAG TPA: hypothetical protein VI854_10015 [Acidimicrobiia bacterium]|nr:hypothetical protein [Acidimicrobiia bacterium]
MANGGADKPGCPGGVDRSDQDGNNGCGNDADFEDDNNGRCGGLVKQSRASDTEGESGSDEARPEDEADEYPDEDSDGGESADADSDDATDDSADDSGDEYADDESGTDDGADTEDGANTESVQDEADVEAEVDASTETGVTADADGIALRGGLLAGLLTVVRRFCIGV